MMNRTRCSSCLRLVQVEDMIICCSCEESVCNLCFEKEKDIWRDRPECCRKDLPPLCIYCEEDHIIGTCNSCGLGKLCQDELHTCVCENVYCSFCQQFCVYQDVCVNCFDYKKKY